MKFTVGPKTIIISSEEITDNAMLGLVREVAPDAKSRIAVQGGVLVTTHAYVNHPEWAIDFESDLRAAMQRVN